MPETSEDSVESKDLITDPETGELRPKLQEGGPGRKPKPREEKAGQFYNVLFDEDNEYTTVGVTNKGKFVNIKRDHMGYYYIHFDKGGQVPRKLRGKYARYPDARNKARLYIEAYI